MKTSKKFDAKRAALDEELAKINRRISALAALRTRKQNEFHRDCEIPEMEKAVGCFFINYERENKKTFDMLHIIDITEPHFNGGPKLYVVRKIRTMCGYFTLHKVHCCIEKESYWAMRGISQFTGWTKIDRRRFCSKIRKNLKQISNDNKVRDIRAFMKHYPEVGFEKDK